MSGYWIEQETNPYDWYNHSHHQPTSHQEKVPDGTEYSNIDGHTTVSNYNEDGDDSEFDEDDKSYETSDDSTMDGDHDVDDEQVQQEEDQ